MVALRERPSRSRPGRRRARPTRSPRTAPDRARPTARCPRARRRGRSRRRARPRARRRRWRRRRRRRTTPGRPRRRRALTRRRRRARSRSTATPSRKSAPAAAACSARWRSSRRRWVIRIRGAGLVPLEPSRRTPRAARPSGRRRARRRARRRTAACRSARPVSPPPHGLSRGKRALSASSTRAPHARGGSPSPSRPGRRPRRGRRNAPRHDRRPLLRPRLQLPARAGVPEWPKGAGCKPAGSAFGGSNPPPCTLRKTGISRAQIPVARRSLKRGSFAAARRPEAASCLGTLATRPLSSVGRAPPW